MCLTSEVNLESGTEAGTQGVFLSTATWLYFAIGAHRLLQI